MAIKFFYSAASMGLYGQGHFWHRFVPAFPDFPRVTKTVTLKPIVGTPWRFIWVPRVGMWNRIGLHNPGFDEWRKFWINNHQVLSRKDVIISLAGSSEDLYNMISLLDSLGNIELGGIEINNSCPNHDLRCPPREISISQKFPMSLKLAYHQNPEKYDLDKFDRISLNSVPTGRRIGGGLSGKWAQVKNWSFILTYQNKLDIPIAGCSITHLDHVKQMEDYGCEEIAIGSLCLTNPGLVRRLGKST